MISRSMYRILIKEGKNEYKFYQIYFGEKISDLIVYTYWLSQSRFESIRVLFIEYWSIPDDVWNELMFELQRKRTPTFVWVDMRLLKRRRIGESNDLLTLAAINLSGDPRDHLQYNRERGGKKSRVVPEI